MRQPLTTATSNSAAVLKSRRKILEELRADPDDPRHGTLHGYNCGCKCLFCRAEGRWSHLERSNPELYAQRVSEAIDEIAKVLNGV